MTTAECLIVGGGPAGAALSIELAKQGRGVLLLEKEAGPRDKVCGEFLSAEAVRYLSAAGLPPATLGAIPITTVRLAGAELIAEATLPFEAQSLSRRVLDEALLNRARELGVVVIRGCAVNSLSRPASDNWEARLDSGNTFSAHRAFLCTGKHDLHGWPRKPGKQNTLIAFKMHWRLSPSALRGLGSAVELVVFPGGYCGLQPIENGIANLALLVEREMFSRLRSWQNLLNHICSYSRHLRTRLACADPLWPAPLAAYRIPYGFVFERSPASPWRLGDQAAVVPSFCGTGISIALHSARRAAESIVAGSEESVYVSKLRRDIGKQVRLATWISRTLVHPNLSRYLGAAAGYVPAALPFLAGATRLPA